MESKHDISIGEYYVSTSKNQFYREGIIIVVVERGIYFKYRLKIINGKFKNINDFSDYLTKESWLKLNNVKLVEILYGI